MKFPFTFTRFKPATGGQIALGSDAIALQKLAADNVFQQKNRSIDGFPIQRVAIYGVYTGAGTVAGETITPYIWDALLGAWVQLSTAVALTMGVRATLGGAFTVQPVIAYFDYPALIDLPLTTSAFAVDQGGGAPGNGQIALVANDPGAGAGNGQYDFAAAAILTTP